MNYRIQHNFYVPHIESQKSYIQTRTTKTSRFIYLYFFF